MGKLASLTGRWRGGYRRAIFRVALFGALALVSCAKGGAKLAPLPADAVVLAFGDSLTYGTGASPEESYPAVLGRVIGRTVINAGIPGEVTAGGVTRLPETLDRYRPALLLLCLGGNDLLRNLDEKQTADNIRAMVGLARDKGADVVLIGVPKFGLSSKPPSFYRQIAREFNVPYEGDILKRILTKNSLKADYIHPNAQGYKLLAEGVAALMKKSGAL